MKCLFFFYFIGGNLRNLPAMPVLHIKADATVLFTKFINC